MTQFIPPLKPCGVGNRKCVNPTKIHKLSFFTAMYCLSLGTGGIKPSLESFGADQFDDNSLKERKGKMSYFNWWNASLCGGLLLGVTVMAYVLEGKKPSRKLSTVTKVEETKLIVLAVPIWFTSLLFGVCVAQGGTFYVKQSSTMNRNIDHNPGAEENNGERKGAILQRVGIGMIFSVVGMVVAALVEKQWLIVAEKERSRVLSMSVFLANSSVLYSGDRRRVYACGLAGVFL
ncbi:hypothetical protein L1987_25043 [Smallanthus sonchifolius]|uniref:Uncharacterized protein n=1 Tax=Smallanthus sonchifolius TaxID=185202 RepID=A0ACB9INW2_9ASTR|nr:hypothetical protein L1987_25043 [Smallanthus sonchifolius]